MILIAGNLIKIIPHRTGRPGVLTLGASGSPEVPNPNHQTSLPTETHFKFKLEKKTSPNVWISIWISKSHPALQGSSQFPHGYLHRPSRQHWAQSPCRIHSGTRQGRWGTGRSHRGSGSRSTRQGLQTETQAMLLQPSAFQCLGSYNFYNCQVPEYNCTSS